MSVTTLITALGFSSIGYMVLAIQLYFGLPPFYRKPFYLPPHVTVPLEDIQRGCLLVVPYIFALIVLLWLWAVTKLLLIPVAIAIVAIKAGRLLRTELHETGMSSDNRFNHLLFKKNPMLLFDVWAIGLSIILGLFLIIPGSK